MKESFFISLSQEDLTELKEVQKQTSSKTIENILNQVHNIMNTRDKDFYNLRHGGYGYGF